MNMEFQGQVVNQDILLLKVNFRGRRMFLHTSLHLAHTRSVISGSSVYRSGPILVLHSPNNTTIECTVVHLLFVRRSLA